MLKDSLFSGYQPSLTTNAEPITKDWRSRGACGFIPEAELAAVLNPDVTTSSSSFGLPQANDQNSQLTVAKSSVAQVEAVGRRSTPILTDENVFQRPSPILLELNSPTLTVDQTQSPLPVTSTLAAPAPSSTLVRFTPLAFSGNEGSSGTIQIQLAQAPTTAVTLTLAPGNFLVVDADNNLQNGTQTTLTFTAQNWNQAQTVWFMAENDGVATDRLIGNTIAYTLSGGLLGTGSYDLGPVKNTYAPDLTKFNIELDFRNDTSGFWTEARQAIAQKAADDWAGRIANEWTGLQLDTSLSKIGDDGNYSGETFATKRYVDDLLVFVNTINTNGVAGGYGGIEYDFGGWASSPELKPRVGQVVIDPAVGDYYLYNAVLHELGHTLGLVGLNWEGFTQQNLSSPQTAVFNGLYSTAANGGKPIPLQSQDGPNSVTGTYDYWHPASSVSSIMSYGWIYWLSGPTAIDFAMLADSGYSIYGVNTPALAPTPTPRNLAIV